MAKKRGRPKREGNLFEFHIHLRLRYGEDDDLIAFFSSIPVRCRVAALKIALRSGSLPAANPDQQQEVPDDEIFDALEDMLS